MSLAVFALMLAGLPAVGVRDNWVPHTDGRTGGCYSTPSGFLYSCSREPKVRAGEEPEASSPGAGSADPSAELREVRRELEVLKQRQAELDLQRAAEDAEREAAARPEREAEQRDLEAAMEAYNAIEAAKDSQRLRELGEKTEACRKTLEGLGYRIMGPGACRAPDGTYLNCPEC